jgi:hypothetical protein
MPKLLTLFMSLTALTVPLLFAAMIAMLGGFQ